MEFAPSVGLAGEGVAEPGETEIQRYYYLRDYLGSVRALEVNEAGTVVHYDDYYLFGRQMLERSLDSEAPKERYTGHELDGETGLLYAGAPDT